jgi:hypothetical protein
MLDSSEKQLAVGSWQLAVCITEASIEINCQLFCIVIVYNSINTEMRVKVGPANVPQTNYLNELREI